MPTNYLLDTGPLGLLAHDRPVHRIPIQTWLIQQLTAGATVYVAEVADYEVRRELTRLIRAGQLPASRLNRLDQLASIFTYLPVSTAMWRRAADFWADARQVGLPTASSAALDADVLIAAQADDVQATVVTNNPAHIGRWVTVHPWP
ncbi:MAG: PIN domain-containing protein [Planctomycetes bacterium]|nr:PIN domain-containing protein [Planctomycetota bacterium]